VRRLFYVLYLAEAILIVWCIKRIVGVEQSDVTITAYLSVIVGAISASIAQGTFQFLLYERAQTRKANAPYLLLVGRRFSTPQGDVAASPEVSWEELPKDGKKSFKVRYGLLNKGNPVVIERIRQRDGLFRLTEVEWETFEMTKGTRWRRSYGTGSDMPYEANEILPSTPIFVTWLNFSATYGRSIEIQYTNPESKDPGRSVIDPESLPIASLNFYRQSREASATEKQAS